MRDLFLSFRSFVKRVADFVRYRNATRDMDARYPNATPDEVGREDVCIICREEMRPVIPNNDANGPPQRTNPVAERMRPKKLPCGHVLHFSCLRSWLERQQNCPTCRRPVIVTERIEVQAGNHPALPGNGAGQAGGPALPGNAPEQAGRNRARIINFGPLRIGFGAGGGNLIDDLAQRIHNGEQRPPPEQAANAGGQQHFGFGFGFGRRPNPRNQNQGPPTIVPIHAQLDQIEGSLQQQISSLRVASNELHVVRMLNNELVRLRNLHATGAQHGMPQPPSSAPAPLPPLAEGHLPPVGYQPTPIMLSSQSQQLLSSDSDALPEGMTLPPGWNLLPLQRSDSHNRTTLNNSGATMTQPATASIPSASQTIHASPQSHPLPGHTDAFPSTSPPTAAGSNGTHLASPAVSPPTTQQAGLGLPSWGSAPVEPNGEGPTEQTRDTSPVRNGHPDSEEASDEADAGERPTEKGKSKLATVEDLVDDVD